jgi:hypothetical protein
MLEGWQRGGKVWQRCRWPSSLVDLIEHVIILGRAAVDRGTSVRLTAPLRIEGTSMRRI